MKSLAWCVFGILTGCAISVLTSPVNVFEAIGLFVAVLGVGLFLASVSIAASFAVVIAWHILHRGLDGYENDIKDGWTLRKVIKRGVL